MAVQRVTGVLSEMVGDTAVLIGPAGTQVVELNAVGSVVWSAIDGQREVSDLVSAVLAELDDAEQVSVDRCEADVIAFIAELICLELVTPSQ